MIDDNCIFCKIVKGEIPSFTIYENENVKIFMDVSPMSNGHCLVIPKKHFENILDIDNVTLRQLDDSIRIVYPILKEKLGAGGITRLQNNELGQIVKHYHMHLIPRYEKDSFVEKVDSEAKDKIEETFKKIMG